MSRPEFSAAAEVSREILVPPEEMQRIAELAKDCADIALRHEGAVVSDRSLYLGIPYKNERTTPDIYLALQAARFSSLDIDLPRKDDDVRIRISAHDLNLPGRTIELTEFDKPDDQNKRQFFADDSHSRSLAKAGHRIDPTLSQDEVAAWLYRQADVRETDVRRKLRQETDPVRNACDILSTRASQHFAVRQFKLPLGLDAKLDVNLELHGQLIESFNPKNPLEKPLARKYVTWIKQRHDIADQPVTERLLVEFSPDDVLLATDFSTISRANVMLESPDPNYAIGRAAVHQAIAYEDDGVAETFAKVRQRMADHGYTA